MNVVGILDVLAGDVSRLADLLYTAEEPNERCSGIVLIWESKGNPEDGVTLSGGACRNTSQHLQAGNNLEIAQPGKNLFVALQDAIHLDLGYNASNNIFTNKTAFNTLIGPITYRGLLERFHNKTGKYPELGAPTRISFPPYPNMTWAQTLTSTDKPVNNITLPVILPPDFGPPVFDINYLCPAYQRKSWGSLIISVFIGTLSMLATVYGLFVWLAPLLERHFYGDLDTEELAHSEELVHMISSAAIDKQAGRNIKRATI
ncbi:hypothetical protein FRC07_001679 [Ceratobasidium sp. 392]|nr:hypothetical protein FRC07_001679 [Ceratobasidium sp. 392]